MAKLLHFTEGGPWFGYTRQEHVETWMAELDSLLVGGNPRASKIRNVTPLRIDYEVIYEQKTHD